MCLACVADYQVPLRAHCLVPFEPSAGALPLLSLAVPDCAGEDSDSVEYFCLSGVTTSPQVVPTESPSGEPTEAPVEAPTESPTGEDGEPTEAPVVAPTESPTGEDGEPTETPVFPPTESPTEPDK